MLSTSDLGIYLGGMLSGYTEGLRRMKSGDAICFFCFVNTSIGLCEARLGCCLKRLACAL